MQKMQFFSTYAMRPMSNLWKQILSRRFKNLWVRIYFVKDADIKIMELLFILWMETHRGCNVPIFLMSAFLTKNAQYTHTFGCRNRDIDCSVNYAVYKYNEFD